MPARRACAAASCSGDWLPQPENTRIRRPIAGRTAPGVEGSRLRRGPEFHDRISFCWGPVRSPRPPGWGFRPASCEPACDEWRHGCGGGSEGCDLDDPDCLCDWRRSRAVRAGGQSEPPGRQYHRRNQFLRYAGSETTWLVARTGAKDGYDRVPGKPQRAGIRDANSRCADSGKRGRPEADGLDCLDGSRHRRSLHNARARTRWCGPVRRQPVLCHPVDFRFSRSPLAMACPPSTGGRNWPRLAA